MSKQKQLILHSYPSDLTGAQWELLSPLSETSSTELARKYPVRLVLNAIFYVNRTGCQWSFLPPDFSSWPVVYSQFRRLQQNGTWDKVHDTLLTGCGRLLAVTPNRPLRSLSPNPQRPQKKGPCGYDAGKKVKGRKRHLLVDTQGLLLEVIVHTADVQDRDGAKLVFEKVKDRYPGLQLIWVDGGYRGKLIEWTKENCDWILEIVKRNGETLVASKRYRGAGWLKERLAG